MNHGKPPGIDGILPEFYPHFWSDLEPVLLEMIQVAIKAGSFHKDINSAIITHIQGERTQFMYKLYI